MKEHDWSGFDALTDEEVHARALADPDAQPLTEERLARMRRVPRAWNARPRIVLKLMSSGVRTELELPEAEVMSRLDGVTFEKFWTELRSDYPGCFGVTVSRELPP